MVALFAVAMILAALTADYIVVRIARREPLMKLAPAALRKSSWLQDVPTGYFLDPSHMWADPEVSGCLRIGTDEFATALLGKPEAISLQARRGAIWRGDPLAVLTVGGRALTLRSPVDGEIVEDNPVVTQQPEAIHDDPFRSGWLSRLRPLDGAADLKRLNTGDRARAWLGEESQRLRSFLISHLRQAGAVGATMADGGPLETGLGLRLDDDSWRELERTFYAAQGAGAAEKTEADKLSKGEPS